MGKLIFLERDYLTAISFVFYERASKDRFILNDPTNKTCFSINFLMGPMSLLARKLDQETQKSSFCFTGPSTALPIHLKVLKQKNPKGKRTQQSINMSVKPVLKTK